MDKLNKKQIGNLISLTSEFLSQVNKEPSEGNNFEEEINSDEIDSDEIDSEEIDSEEIDSDEIDSDEIENVEETYPWTEYIQQFENLPEFFSINDLDQFAKNTLSKNQLTQLQNLHNELMDAKAHLEEYFKKPPISRTELDEEISAIQNAMADLLSNAGVRRIIVDPYVYSLRKVRTHFKITSEKKAVESLKKKKLGRFIKRTESIDMAGLREFLVKSKMTIPGLRRVEGEESIYIYEKHEENYELVNVIEPDGVVRFATAEGDFQELPKSKMQFAVKRVRDFLQKNSVVYTKRPYNLPDGLVNAEGIGRALREKVGEATPELLQKYVKQSGFDTVEEWSKPKFGKHKKMYLYKVTAKPSIVEIGRHTIQPLHRDLTPADKKTVALVGAPERLPGPTKLPKPKQMGIIGSTTATKEMYDAAMHQTKQAIEAGWGIVTGGARGPDAAAIEEVLKHGDDVVRKLTVYLPKAIGDQPSQVIGLLRKAKNHGAKIMEYAGAQLELGLTPKFLTAEDLASELGKKLGAVPLQRARFARDKLITKDIDALNAIQVARSKGTQAGINRAIEKKIPILRIDEELNKIRLPDAIVGKKAKFMGNLKKILKLKKAGSLLPGVVAILMIPDLIELWNRIKEATGRVKEGKGSEEDQQLVGLLKEQSEEMSEGWEERDEGLPWHKIPKDQRLGDIDETINNLEPRKSDPFPEPVVEFIMEKHEQGLSIEEIDKALVEMIEKGDLSSWTMYISDSEGYQEFQQQKTNQQQKINAPTFAYQTIFGKNPPEFLRGRTDAPKKMWKNLLVDEGLKTEWLEELNNLPVEIRSTEEGKDKNLRPAFVIFRLPPKYDDLHNKMVENLKKFPGLYAKSGIGGGNRPRICVAGTVIKNESGWSEWWNSLAKKIKEAYEKTIGAEKKAEDPDLFVSNNINEVLKDPEKNWRRMFNDLKILGNFAYPKLSEGKKWGEWDLDTVLEFFGKIVDTLRKVFFPIIPPEKDEKNYDTPYWSCYRKALEKGYIKTEPPPEEEIKEWDGKRKTIIKFSENDHPGLYLVQPHSELIWAEAKTAIVKSKKFDKNINVPLYLISDDKCYGVIKLSEPVEIDKKEFKDRYSEHLVENFERREWWDGDSQLWLYGVEMIEKFEEPRKVEIPVGIQVFLKPESINFEE